MALSNVSSRKRFLYAKLLTNDENYIYKFKDMINLSTMTNWRFAQMNSFEQNKFNNYR